MAGSGPALRVAGPRWRIAGARGVVGGSWEQYTPRGYPWRCGCPHLASIGRRERLRGGQDDAGGEGDVGGDRGGLRSLPPRRWRTRRSREGVGSDGGSYVASSVALRVSRSLARFLRVDVEAEHHSALVVFRDVAVRHPSAGVGDVQQQVYDLTRRHEDGVLPDEVRLGGSVAGEDEEAAGAVDVERVVHRMVRVHLVDEADLHAIADAEAPIDPCSLRACRAVDQLPARVRRRGHAVDGDHVVFPLDSARGVGMFGSYVVMVVLI